MHGHVNVKLSQCTVTWTSNCHDARSRERQIVTMHGHVNVKLSRCTVTWTSNCHNARSRERQIVTMHGHVNVKLSRCTVTWTSDCHDVRSRESQMFRYICIILRVFQSCTLLKLHSFYIVKIYHIKVFVWLLSKKCSLYDFYNIICISSMFTCSYIHLDILQ